MMPTPTDAELLRRYAKERVEAAFGEVVRRHTDFVYSVARRVTQNGALAEEVTQTVFTKLAREAGGLAHSDTIAGWLHTAARNAAINTVRGEERRRAREQEATAMQILDSAATDTTWTMIAPMLDEAVDALDEDDRKAVLLRFFSSKSHREIGDALGLNENSANKRVERALEKLRGHFEKRGVTATGAVLAETIGIHSVQAAPASLSDKITRASLAAAAGSGPTGASLPTLIIMNTKTKIALGIALALILCVGTLWHGGALAPAKAQDAKPAVAPEPVKTSPPPVAGIAPIHTAPAPISQPAAPAVAAAPISAPPPAAAAIDPSSNPQLHIETAISDFVTLLQAGKFVQAANNYLQLPPNISGEQLIEGMEQNPDFPNTIAMFIESTKAAQTTTPTYDATGTIATYTLDPPVQGKTTVRWKKINNMWFVDGYD